ncbi:cytochrome P450 [Tateyamaria omphalii]|uniref:cytochrome P450 n=1 Tax=Tateyamaria omphalii TaxID=299262 RepID=UPI001678BD10|nr:cytochrome P450 [Tateyamaria omphalii]
MRETLHTCREVEDVDVISALVEPAIDRAMAPLFGFTTNEMTRIRESGVGVYKNLTAGLAQIKPSIFEADNTVLVDAFSDVVGRPADAWTEQDYAIVFLCTVVLQPLSDLAANTLAFIAPHPELQEAARASRGGTTAFWSEAERYFISARYIHRQSFGDGMSVGANHIPGGARFICDIAAANRDPSRWPNPDDFDPARAPLSNLAFGAGPHRCLGVALSRQFLPQFLWGVLRVANVSPGKSPVKRRCTMAVEEPIEIPLAFKMLEVAR